MSDRNITELEWRKFSKGRGFKDGAFVKALAALETGKTPEAKLAALEDIEKQADLLRRANKADRELGSYLDDAEKAAGKERKQQDAEARKMAAQSSSTEDEEESPALLTTRMIPLLRELRKGEVTMPALICTAGKSAAVLVMRRSIAPARRKMLAEFIDASGGAKYISGECRYENNVLTFIVQGAAAGLAKRLRQAVYEQTNLRLKVLVRGDDGEEHDGDNEELDPSQQASEAAQQQPSQAAQPADAEDIRDYVARRRELEESLQAALRARHPEANKLRAVCGFADDKAKAHDFAGAHKALDMLEKLLVTTPAQPVASPANEAVAAAHEDQAGLAFNHRLAALLPSIKQGLAAGGEAAPQIRLKVSEAGTLARKKDLESAGALLDEVEALLAQSAQTQEDEDKEDEEETEGPLDEDQKDDTPAPPKPRTHVAFTQTRLDWDQARKQVLTQLGMLKASIVQASGEEEDFAEIRSGVGQLYEILEILDERLIDKLDDALNASGDARANLQREASGIVDEYLDFVSTDALMQDIDRNGFVDLDIQSSLMTRLRRMNEALLATD